MHIKRCFANKLKIMGRFLVINHVIHTGIRQNYRNSQNQKKTSGVKPIL